MFQAAKLRNHGRMKTENRLDAGDIFLSNTHTN